MVPCHLPAKFPNLEATSKNNSLYHSREIPVLIIQRVTTVYVEISSDQVLDCGFTLKW